MAAQPKEVSRGDSIMRKTAILLRNFIFEEVKQNVSQATIELVREKLEPQGPCEPHFQEIAINIRKLGDELDGRSDVQSLKQKVVQLTKESFMRIAFEVFSDGIYNWGRVVILFIFASGVVIKAITDNSFEAIKDIVSWALEFIKFHVLDWIVRQGGWEACLAYAKKPRLPMALAIVGVAVLAIILIRKWKGSATIVDK